MGEIKILKIKDKRKLLLKKKDDTKEMTKRFLEAARKNRVDFGKNWLDEIDTLL